MRNRFVHVYFPIDTSAVWRTVQDEIPALIALLEPLVEPEECG